MVIISVYADMFFCSLSVLIVLLFWVLILFFGVFIIYFIDYDRIGLGKEMGELEL